MRGREEGCCVGEDCEGVGGLAFGEEGDGDWDGVVAVVGYEAGDEGVAEGLDGGRGAGEPGCGDAEDFGTGGGGERG